MLSDERLRRELGREGTFRKGLAMIIIITIIIMMIMIIFKLI